jgi:Protein of unknown function (DUF2752)
LNTAAIATPPKLRTAPRPAAWSWLMAGAVLAGTAGLYFVDPARHEIYPCLLRATTGLRCPGCGGLRATHQLLHGHLSAAWNLNPLAVLLVPFYALLACQVGLGLVHGRGLRWTTPRPALIWLGLAGIILFGILRNLPWF